MVFLSPPKEANAHEKCEYLMKLAVESLKVQKVLKKIEDEGCEVPQETFFRCQPCAPNEGIVGGFVTDPSQKREVVLCEDNIEKFNVDVHHVQRTVIHELIHAYDACRVKMDWKNCLHIACSEIRAANLSGDCDMKQELNRGKFAFSGQGTKCIKRRAGLSLKAHEQCEATAEEAIERVFEPCFKDRAPFVGKHF